MTIYLDDENLDEFGTILKSSLEAAISQPVDLSSQEQQEKIDREKKVAADSLLFPTIQPIQSNPFTPAQKSSLIGKISEVPVIGKKVTESSDPVVVLPVRPKSIFEHPPANPVERIVQYGRNLLELKKDELVDRANQAETPTEISKSSKEMIDFMSTSEKIVEETVMNAKTPFPNLAREIMILGDAKEKFETEKRLKAYQKEGNECKSKIDLLLKLSSHLPKLTSDDTPYALKDETKLEILKLHDQLKGKGIDIFPGMTFDNELSKEQLTSANSLINHHIEVNRTSLQELFTTKINISIQFLTMLGEVMKKISDKDNQLKQKTAQLPR